MKDHFALHNNLGYWLARLSTMMHADFMSWLSKYDVTGSQWMTLNALYFKNAHSGSTIADYVGVDRGAITRVLDQLEEKGLVTRQTTSHDRRAQLVELTDKGTKIMEKILKECSGKEERFTHVLSEEELKILKKALMKMASSANLPKAKLGKNF